MLPDHSARKKLIIAAAAIALLAVAAAFLLHSRSGWYLTLRNAQTGELYARYAMSEDQWFSVQFIHSVNKSPLTDCYQIKDKAIYVEKTVYYGFGAGVQTEIEPGQDYCTLITCTPYGINTHRLLVRGHRVENQAEAKTVRVTADAMQIEPVLVAPAVAAPMLLLLLIWVLVSDHKKKKR